MLKKKKQQNSLVVFPHPIWKICSSKWVHFPQFLGWSWKIFELPPPRRLFWTETWHLSQVGHVSPTWTTTEIAWEISQNKRSGRIKRSLTWYVVLFQIVLDKQTKKKWIVFICFLQFMRYLVGCTFPATPGWSTWQMKPLTLGFPKRCDEEFLLGNPHMPHSDFKIWVRPHLSPESCSWKSEFHPTNN